MVRDRPRSVLVTDADRGVGRATAIYLGEHGFRVLAGGRDLEKMEDLPRETGSRGTIEVTQLDTSDAASCEAATEATIDLFGSMDGVVWAGGRAAFGPVEEENEEAAAATMEENLGAPWRLLRIVAPRLRVQAAGTIVCVSSAAGRVALPLGGAYSASRFALEGLCDALRLELGVFGVHVVLVEPGLLRERVGAPTRKLGPRALFGVEPKSPYAGMAKLLADGYKQLIARAATEDQVARVVAKALRSRKPRARYAVTRGTAAMLLARKLLPDRMVDRRVVKAIRKRGAKGAKAR